MLTLCKPNEIHTLSRKRLNSLFAETCNELSRLEIRERSLQSEIQDMKVEIRRRLDITHDPSFKVNGKKPIVRPNVIAGSSRQLQRVLSYASEIQNQINGLDSDLQNIHSMIKSKPKETPPKQVGLVKSTYLRKVCSYLDVLGKKEDGEDYQLCLTLLSEDKKDIKMFLQRRKNTFNNEANTIDQYIDGTTTQCFKLVSKVETIREEMNALLDKGNQPTKLERTYSSVSSLQTQRSVHFSSSSRTEDSFQMAIPKEKEYERILYQRNRLRTEVDKLRRKTGKRATLDPEDFEPSDMNYFYTLSKEKMPGQINIKNNSLLEKVKKLHEQKHASEKRISRLRKLISKYEPNKE